jgi:hypothetical protein
VSLSEVSKSLHRTFIPAVYETFVVSAGEQNLDRLEISPMKTYFRVDGSRDIFNSLSCVKDLRFIAPIHEYRRKRCYRNLYNDGSSAECDFIHRMGVNKLIHDNFMKKLLDTFRYSVFHLPKDSLRSFAYVVVKYPA